MTKKVVILIQSDPRKTPRPTEAIRIALGLSGHHAVELILAPVASLLLAHDGGDLEGADMVQSYLLLLQERIGLFLITRDVPTTSVPYTGPYKTSFIHSSEMAQKIAGADCFMLF